MTTIEEEEVYLVVTGINELCGNHEHLKMFRTYSTEDGDYKTIYFQTFGGGPEGGYFLRTFIGLNGFDPVDEVYRVERTWGTAFRVQRVNGQLDYNESGDGTAGTCRIIPNYTSETVQDIDGVWWYLKPDGGCGRWVRDLNVASEEFCEEHEQPMWKNGLKCGGCLDDETSAAPQGTPQSRKSP